MYMFCGTVDEKSQWLINQWYWSLQEAGRLIKSLLVQILLLLKKFSTGSQLSFCSKYEHILSDHFDYVSPDTVSSQFSSSVKFSSSYADDIFQVT